MKKLHFLASAILAAGTVLLSTVSCQEETPDTGGIEHILLSRHTLSLTTGGEYSLTYTVLPETAETEESAVWTSSDESIAKVADGTVTAVAAGEAQITLTLGSCTDICSVNVSDMQLDSILLNETEIRLPIGGTAQLEATPMPEEAACSLQWSSDNGDIASVDENGMVTAISEGLAIIKVSAGDIYAKCSIIVDPLSIEDVSLTPGTMELNVGEKSELSLTIEPQELADSYVLWTSDNDHVATVAGGTVSALQAGKAVITATVGGVSASCTVTVSNIEVESVNLNYTEYTLKQDESIQLTATVLPENATVKDVTWTTSDRNVAVVGQNGLVLGVTPGEAVITATSGGKSATCTVTVERESGGIGDTDWQVGDLFDVAGYDKGIVAAVSSTSITIMHMQIGYAQWSTSTRPTLIDDAINDGKESTEGLKAFADDYPGEYPAVEWCASQGDHWYMPTSEELFSILQNHEVLKTAMAENGGSELINRPNTLFWCCWEFWADVSLAAYVGFDSTGTVTNGNTNKAEEHYIILLQRIDF